MLHDLRKSRVWQEAYTEGFQTGFAIGFTEGFKESMATVRQERVHNCLARRMPVKDIAALLGISVKEVRRFAKTSAK